MAQCERRQVETTSGGVSGNGKVTEWPENGDDGGESLELCKLFLETTCIGGGEAWLGFVAGNVSYWCNTTDWPDVRSI